MDESMEIFANTTIGIAIVVVAALLVLVGIVAVIVGIVLSVSYVKYNHKNNSAGLTGAEAARILLDSHGLNDIKVKSTGSMFFGNSYGRYGKCVRIRRLTRNRTSITALAIGSQKAALAIMDREGDPDMKKRYKLVPLVTFGPFAFIPLIIIGVVIDFVVANTGGIALLVTLALSVVLYVLAMIAAAVTLKTEKKAQERCCELLIEGKLANEEEIADIKGLFKLYNVQYINNIIISSLKVLYYVLRLVAAITNANNNESNA